MIEVEIVSYPDEDKIGIFKFYKNLIYVGNNHESDLYFSHSDIGKNTFHIECLNKKLVIYPNSNVDKYHVNKKIVTTKRELRTGDTISYSKLVFKIVSFEEQVLKTKVDLLNQKVQELKPEDEIKIKIIEILKNDES